MKIRLFKWLPVVLAIGACDSPLDTNPTIDVDAETALKTGAAIQQAVLGAYRNLASSALYSRQEVVFPDLYADNLDFTGTFQTDRDYSLRAVPTNNTSNRDTWQAAYAGIGRVNFILDALESVENMAQADMDRARGEALFLRALQYSILVRWFGGVPLVTEPTKALNDQSFAVRATQQEVYAQIEADLEAAVPLLPATRSAGRATQGAANALLARVYLEDAKYTQARDKATAVIANTTYRLVTNYRDLFTAKHTTESIFELHYAGGENTNSLAFWFFDQSVGGRRGFQPNLALFNSYEANDPRRAASITSQGTRPRIGFKYFRIAAQDDNVHVVRLAEMYLIRAEANMRLNAAADVVRADIDVVRARAGLLPLPVTVTTQTQLIDAILQERRVEFAMEGHRFFDLRRLGRAMTVLNIPAERLVMPIPQQERDVNDNLVQNPGY